MGPARTWTVSDFLSHGHRLSTAVRAPRRHWPAAPGFRGPENRRGSYSRCARRHGEYGCAWATDARRTDAPVVTWDLRGSHRPNSPAWNRRAGFPAPPRFADQADEATTPQRVARSRRPRPSSTGTAREGGGVVAVVRLCAASAGWETVSARAECLLESSEVATEATAAIRACG